MNDNQYSAHIRAAKAARYDIHTFRKEPLSESFDIPFVDFSGEDFLAEVRLVPGLTGDPLITLVVDVDEVVTKTYQQWIDDCVMQKSDVPPCEELSKSMSISTLTVSAYESLIALVPLSDSAGSSSEVYWSLTQLTPDKKVIATGKFIVVESV